MVHAPVPAIVVLMYLKLACVNLNISCLNPPLTNMDWQVGSKNSCKNEITGSKNRIVDIFEVPICNFYLMEPLGSGEEAKCPQKWI